MPSHARSRNVNITVRPTQGDPTAGPVRTEDQGICENRAQKSTTGNARILLKCAWVYGRVWHNVLQHGQRIAEATGRTAGMVGRLALFRCLGSMLRKHSVTVCISFLAKTKPVRYYWLLCPPTHLIHATGQKIPRDPLDRCCSCRFIRFSSDPLPPSTLPPYPPLPSRLVPSCIVFALSPSIRLRLWARSSVLLLPSEIAFIIMLAVCMPAFMFYYMKTINAVFLQAPDVVFIYMDLSSVLYLSASPFRRPPIFPAQPTFPSTLYQTNFEKPIAVWLKLCTYPLFLASCIWQCNMYVCKWSINSMQYQYWLLQCDRIFEIVLKIDYGEKYIRVAGLRFGDELWNGEFCG